MTIQSAQEVLDRHAVAEPVRRVVRNGDIEVAFFVQGNPAGPTILLVHGWPDSHHLWDEVVPLLRDRFQLVAIDSRGAGATTNPKSYKGFQLTKQASDYVAVADAISPHDAVHLLGHDWGSVAAWEAVCDPNVAHRFASFTSVSGPCASHLSHAVRQRFSRPTPRNVALATGQAMSLLYMLGSMTPGVPNAMLKLTMNEKRWRTALSRAEGIPADRIHLGSTFRKDITRTLRVYRANALQAMISPQDRFTDVPVQVIVGRRDPAVRQSSYEFEPTWNRRTWLRVLDGGHWLPFSHPQLLASAAAELIDSVTGGPSARTLRRASMDRQHQRFEDELVVITGGGSGIGRETALEFARCGADLVISDIDLASAKQTAAQVTALGGLAHAYRLDVSDAADIERHAAEVLARHGVPDVLVNNAGVGAAGDFLLTPPDEFERVIDTNMYGVVRTSRAFATAMVDRGLGGHIVNLSSMAAYAPQQEMSAYSTSKAAVFMFSDCLRADLAPHNIGVTTVCPGVVHTNIVANTRVSGVTPDQEERIRRLGNRAYALRRYGPHKVARQIVAAVRNDRDVVPVTPEAKIQYFVNRLAPGAVRRAARRGGMTRLIDRVPRRW